MQEGSKIWKSDTKGYSREESSSGRYEWSDKLQLEEGVETNGNGQS